MTNAEIVSRITNGGRLLSKDSTLSKRYILHVAEKAVEFLISHKLKDKSLFRESIYSSIGCFDLEPKDTYSCGVIEFKSCNKLMKSKKKLPKLISSRYGAAIRSVTSIDFMADSDFTFSTLEQFKRNRKRLNGNEDNNHFYIKDGYLYIPDSDIRKVSFEVLIVNTFNLSNLDSNFEKDCRSAWEYEFICPDKLLNPMIEMVRNELNLPLQIPKDENPNMDSNIKSRA
jgi:hypothetical protein